MVGVNNAARWIYFLRLERIKNCAHVVSKIMMKSKGLGGCYLIKGPEMLCCAGIGESCPPAEWEAKMMWGRHKENGVWISPKVMYRFLWINHDALFIALWRFRLRVMK